MQKTLSAMTFKQILAETTFGSSSDESGPAKVLNASFWQTQTEEELSALKTRCDTHWTTTSPVLHSAPLCFLLALTLAASFVAWLIQSDKAFQWTGTNVMSVAACFVMTTLITAAVIAVVVTGLGALLGLHCGGTLSELLEPLSNSQSNCERALACVHKSTTARAYRDSVVATGRQLRHVDYRMLANMHFQDERRASEEHSRALCRELHDTAVLGSPAPRLG